MNAVDFLKQHRKFDRVANNNIPTSKEPTLEDITVDDVIYGDFKKSDKKNILQRMNTDHDKVQKNNSKILKMYIKQQAKIINDMDF